MEGLHKFQFRRQERKETEDPTGLSGRVSSCDIFSTEEKDYQKSVREKLKSAADWDVRESKMFSIG